MQDLSDLPIPVQIMRVKDLLDQTTQFQTMKRRVLESKLQTLQARLEKESE